MSSETYVFIYVCKSKESPDSSRNEKKGFKGISRIGPPDLIWAPFCPPIGNVRRKISSMHQIMTVLN